MSSLDDVPPDDGVRWVQYMTPVFVRVQADEDGWGASVTKVVVVTDPEAMEPVLDERGQEIVYRTDGEQVRGHMVPGAVNTSAVFTAADIGRWLAKEMFLSGGWDDGEDPRTDGFEWYMDDVDGEDEDELDDDEVDDGDDGYVLVDVD